MKLSIDAIYKGTTLLRLAIGNEEEEGGGCFILQCCTGATDSLI